MDIKNDCQGTHVREKDWYKRRIEDIVDKIKDEKLLKRIYDLAEYLYIYK